ncbi:MAG: hypothetical protein AB2L14_18345 [Candidatus Xenobiia bacterium LiM19]
MVMNIKKRHTDTDIIFILSAFILLFTLMLALPSAPVNADTEENDCVIIYRNTAASFLISLPSSVVLKSETSGRAVWNYSTVDNLNVTLRLNYIYIGINVNPDEYLKILFDSKKNEGIEPQWQNIKGGKGFTYEIHSGKTDNDLVSFYLVAISERGWLCTTTAMGRMSVLKKEPKLFTTIFDSFEYFTSPGK